ncbi:type II 3-dehydroquinate dehydratase [Ferrimicrobium acidiphilum]|uniref:type II 3-dehydroquinate dehydratase n=1 Tax=Ferrimicrobium acidiphilum TaxID=121039 RepID=UPI0023F1E7E1|nr:type II 3-dehydroquinate dehydratase [Ferrimicrobium acidiphilum]
MGAHKSQQGQVAMRPSIALVHGPNLNLLGERQPEIYGMGTLDDLTQLAREAAIEHGYELASLQTNSEAELIEAIHGLDSSTVALILNAGAFTHYSWAIADAIASKNVPTIELHISNPAARENFRTLSVLAAVVSGSISGFGEIGYVLAVQAAALLDQGVDSRRG